MPKGYVTTTHPPLQSSGFTLLVLLPLAVANALVRYGCWADKQSADMLQWAGMFPSL